MQYVSYTNLRVWLFYLLLLSSPSFSFAQAKVWSYDIGAQYLTTLELKHISSSLAISSNSSWQVGEIMIIDGTDTIIMLVHDSEEFGPFYSHLYIPEKPSNSISIVNKTGRGFKLHTHNISPLQNQSAGLTIQGPNPCEKPHWIDQSIWRLGLDPPLQNPLTTNVKHLIVHHSAGSNTNLNFTDVVRNIYVYHTKSRGWNDIGYNFLVAQDGTIYAGRDPQGATSQDNVLGAHFCSKNSLTMGVCLLGNYSDTIPKLSMLKALEKILVWKLYKEQLLPLDSFPHPGQTDPNLLSLVGHRDGCATQCPGNNMYPLLAQIRTNVLSTMKICKSNVAIKELDEQKEYFLLNGTLHITQPDKWKVFKVIDPLGRIVVISQLSGSSFISLNHLSKNKIYLLVFKSRHNEISSFKISL